MLFKNKNYEEPKRKHNQYKRKTHENTLKYIEKIDENTKVLSLYFK